MGDGIKVLVCGARFGQFYLEAVKSDSRYELVGLLARGSDLAKECAKRYHVTLYTNLDAIPEEVDVVCIAVKTGVLGGAGTELAVHFLSKGVNVVLEQPVHYQDLMECYRVARKNHVAFHVGNLYLNLPQVKRYCNLAGQIAERQKILYVNADVATQVSYPFVRILVKLLGKGKKMTWDAINVQEGIFQNLSLRWDDTYVQIRAQNQEGNDVADNCMHLLFQITLGVNSGSLLLTDANGFVFWRGRMEIPKLQFVPGDLPDSEDVSMTEIAMQFVSGTKGTYAEILNQDWVSAVLEDVDAVVRMRNAPDGEKIMAKEGAMELTSAQIWKEFMQKLGYPTKIAGSHESFISFSKLLSEYRSNAPMAEKYAMFSEKDIREAVDQMNAASLISILSYLQEEGFFLEEGQQVSEKDLLMRLPMDPKFEFIIERWLVVLTQNEFLGKEGNLYHRKIRLITKKELSQLWENALKLWKERLGPESVGQYFYESASSLARQLKGEIKANYLLYPEGRNEIANDLYRNTMIAWYLNQKISHGVSDILESRENVRILEVGAGTGATSDVVLRGIREKGLDRHLEEYCYTDLSPYFLMEARKRYEDASWLVTKEVDVNASVISQGIEAHSYDAIIAAGVINNVDNTLNTLKYLSQCLREDGVLFISEAVGEAIQMLISQVFMMQKAKDARENENQTFLSQAKWLEAFERAGFMLEECLPQKDHKLYPLQQVLFVLKPLTGNGILKDEDTK